MKKDFFLKKYKISGHEFTEANLSWSDLMDIYTDHSNRMPELERTAVFIFNSLMKIEGVHSVRYRIKSPEHLIEKIYRKKRGDPGRVITIENYKTEITDLIGLRALHLFKKDWEGIHNQITNTWERKETPIAYYREGDSPEYFVQFKDLDIETKQHPYGYRSVHYVIETKPTKELFFAEIQIRTIFEEAWSEIDHTIRYHYDIDNLIYKEFLLILNRLSGSADEMGTFLKRLQSWEEKNIEQLKERDKTISELEKRLNKDKDYVKSEDFRELIEKIKYPPASLFTASFISSEEFLKRSLETPPIVIPNFPAGHSIFNITKDSKTEESGNNKE